MYAVVKTGGLQYRVKEGDTLEINKIAGDSGEKIVLDEVLMASGEKTQFGSPLVSGASVEAVIKEQKKGDKVTVFKYKRRKNYKRTRGHRQPMTLVEIAKINLK